MVSILINRSNLRGLICVMETAEYRGLDVDSVFVAKMTKIGNECGAS